MTNEGVVLVAKTLKTLPNLEELVINLVGTNTTCEMCQQVVASYPKVFWDDEKNKPFIWTINRPPSIFFNIPCITQVPTHNNYLIAQNNINGQPVPPKETKMHVAGTHPECAECTNVIRFLWRNVCTADIPDQQDPRTPMYTTLETFQNHEIHPLL